MRKLYLISGPLGVGKTSVSATLAQSLQNAALVVGDDLYNFSNETELEWEDKLQKAWDRILPAIKEQIKSGRDVVLDFVIEDELPKIKNYFSDGVQIIYVVLLASKQALRERLAKRGELKYEARSLELLEKLGKDPSNQKYIIETDNKDVSEIVKEIMTSRNLLI